MNAPGQHEERDDWEMGRTLTYDTPTGHLTVNALDQLGAFLGGTIVFTPNDAPTA